jgi:hypothetical protein
MKKDAAAASQEPQLALALSASKLAVASYDADDVGVGFEDFTSDDVAVPFISILQKGSPQVEEDNSKYVAGAKSGHLYNTVSNSIYDGKSGITVVPVHRVRTFIEWIPKDQGGGLVQVYQPDAPEVQRALSGAGRQYGKIKINDNNDLVETFSMFCLLVKDDGTFERAIISFSSSQIGVYKRWMTMAQSVNVLTPDGRLIVPPMFAHKYRLNTVFTQKKDYTWYKFGVRFEGETADASRLTSSDVLYNAAKEFRNMVLRGTARAAFDAAEQDDTASVVGGSSFEM